MRNLIAFYLRFRIFLVFAALQGIALFTYFSYSNFPRLQLLTTTSSINARILEVRNDVTKHFNLSGTNRKLEWENRALREKLRLSLYRTQYPDSSISDTSYNRQYTYIPASVVHNTFDKRDNYMTINVGTNQGIKRGLGVFSSKGVVGIVHYAGKNYSIVKTVLTKDINIDVMLDPGGAFGLLKWDGQHPRLVNVTGIGNDIRIKRWTKVVTRGGSGIFPRGITVGKIKHRAYIEGKPLWDIDVLLAEDLRTIQHVYVIINMMQNELDEIQQHIPKEREEEEPNS